MMRVIESGRFVLPADARKARRFAEENLLSIHGRAPRLRAVVLGARLNGLLLEAEVDEAVRLAAPGSKQWLLVRDYETAHRHRSVVFVFDDQLRAVAKVRRIGAAGQSLRREADVLAALDAPGLPRVQRYVVQDGHEVLVLSPVAGRPLWISMQRSLRPRRAHAAHLANAGRWLGRLHAATRDGDAVAVHGDFWARNILFDGSAVAGVVDWEHGSLRGSPWNDLFTLPLLFVTDAPSWTRCDRHVELRRGFIEHGPLSELVSRYFRAYVASAGSDLRSLRMNFEQWLVENRKEGDWATQMRGASRSVFSG